MTMPIATALCLALVGVGLVTGQAAQFTMTSNGQLIDNTLTGAGVGVTRQQSLMANPLAAYLMQLQQQLQVPMQVQQTPMVQAPQLVQPSQQLQQLQQQIQQQQPAIMVSPMQNINQNFFRAQATSAANFGLSAMVKQELLDNINNLRSEVEATRMYALVSKGKIK